jgi:hypothetical protein
MDHAKLRTHRKLPVSPRSAEFADEVERPCNKNGTALASHLNCAF